MTVRYVYAFWFHWNECQILQSHIQIRKTILSLFTFTRKCYYWCTGFNISAEGYQIFILYTFPIVSIVYSYAFSFWKENGICVCYFIIVMQLKKSHNSSFTDPDARHVGILFIITSSNRVWASFQLVSSSWALVSLHVSVNSLSGKDHYYCRCHKNVWINIFNMQQAAVFNVQENLTLTGWTKTCWPQFTANWNSSDLCTACCNVMLCEWSVMWYVRKNSVPVCAGIDV